MSSFDKPFYHLERAHNILKVGIYTRNVKEIFGQLLRLPLGIIGFCVGIVPTGNTGGSNVSAFMKMPIPSDTQEILSDYI